MQLTDYVNTFGDYLKRRFGESVHKLSLSGNFTCPNRDGSLGFGGCTFCNATSFTASSSVKSIAEQLSLNRSGKSLKYLAYFQAYTSTYAEAKELNRLYLEALKGADIVGLCVGTRPDCLSNEALDLLAEIQSCGYEVWVELGLQTAFDETLKLINRHHTFNDYVTAVKRLHDYNLKICTHLIIGLPSEELLHNLTTLELVLNEGVNALKLHQLHIVKGALMAKQYAEGQIKVLSLEEYAQIAAKIIQYTPKDILFERVSASVMDDSLIAPMWSKHRWPPINAITTILHEQGGQGSLVGEVFKKL